MPGWLRPGFLKNEAEVFVKKQHLLDFQMVVICAAPAKASHAAFAGNFNKAATISISICLGLETLPGGKWKFVMLLGIAGNILAFTAWSYLQAMRNPSKEEGKSPS